MAFEIMRAIDKFRLVEKGKGPKDFTQSVRDYINTQGNNRGAKKEYQVSSEEIFYGEPVEIVEIEEENPEEAIDLGEYLMGPKEANYFEYVDRAITAANDGNGLAAVQLATLAIAYAQVEGVETYGKILSLNKIVYGKDFDEIRDSFNPRFSIRNAYARTLTCDVVPMAKDEEVELMVAYANAAIDTSDIEKILENGSLENLSKAWREVMFTEHDPELEAAYKSLEDKLTRRMTCLRNVQKGGPSIVLGGNARKDDPRIVFEEATDPKIKSGNNSDYTCLF
tara:strand:- start:1097 stop:1939 length:843 start_codon:yes stop_codon:yes gene_type:complete